MNDYQYELIGESIWDIYCYMGNLILERKKRRQPSKSQRKRARSPEHQDAIDRENLRKQRAAKEQAKFDNSVAGQAQARLHQSGNTHIDVTHGAVADAIIHASRTWRGHPDHDKEVDKAAVGASTTPGGDRDLTPSQARNRSFRRHRGSDPTAGATRDWLRSNKPGTT
jgi:hypothetical protein